MAALLTSETAPAVLLEGMFCVAAFVAAVRVRRYELKNGVRAVRPQRFFWREKRDNTISSVPAG